MKCFILTTANAENPNDIDMQLDNASLHDSLIDAQQEASEMCGIEDYQLEWQMQNNIWDASCGMIFFRIKEMQ